jgi:ABC-type dipeptide/oligopeptide/nickel transport system ATPase component
VIYGGVTCEIAPTNQLLGFPQHPYTRALLEAMIDLDRLGRRPKAIPGDSPDPGAGAKVVHLSSAARRPLIGVGKSDQD